MSKAIANTEVLTGGPRHSHAWCISLPAPFSSSMVSERPLQVIIVKTKVPTGGLQWVGSALGKSFIFIPLPLPQLGLAIWSHWGLMRK